MGGRGRGEDLAGVQGEGAFLLCVWRGIGEASLY